MWDKEISATKLIVVATLSYLAFMLINVYAGKHAFYAVLGIFLLVMVPIIIDQAFDKATDKQKTTPENNNIEFASLVDDDNTFHLNKWWL